MVDYLFKVSFMYRVMALLKTPAGILSSGRIIALSVRGTIGC